MLSCAHFSSGDLFWRLGYLCGNCISATESHGGSDSQTTSNRLNQPNITLKLKKPKTRPNSSFFCRRQFWRKGMMLGESFCSMFGEQRGGCGSSSVVGIGVKGWTGAAHHDALHADAAAFPACC